MNINSVAEQLQNTLHLLPLWYAEIALAIHIVLLVFLGLFKYTAQRKTFALLTMAGLGFAAFLLVISPSVLTNILYFKTLVLAVAASTIFLKMFETPSQTQDTHFTEFCILSVAMALGCNALISANHWLLFYLSVELISIASYLLVGFRFNLQSAEAGLKYLLFGAVASAFMLYGISLLYGFAVLGQSSGLVLSVAMLMVLGGMLFKLGAVPYHWWVADVYAAAPSSVVVLLSVTPKIATIQAVIYLFGRFPEVLPWQNLLLWASIASVVAGNLSALSQQNIRRLLAYSSVAHTGVLLLAVATNVSAATIAFYFVAYWIAVVLIFVFIARTESDGIYTSLADFNGLGQRDILSAVAVLVALVSLVGLPPTAGFTAKLRLFMEAWYSYQTQPNTLLFWTFVIAVAGTAFSLYYYLRIPFAMFFRTSEKEISFLKRNYFHELLLVLAAMLVGLFVV